MLTLDLAAVHGNFYYEFQKSVDANEGGHHYAEKKKPKTKQNQTEGRNFRLGTFLKEGMQE